ncbi:MAG: bifunctional (p)ppGpp synthetase/guanosine-3',5'-bis(diphosphate) 3'-pyrophosphohydrolase, partial [Defluviitaleaceae bacterium]|nr:bifunctional (p)ppGpp synthetase/guanosine-3',5'-bis(diphosphate) 3'-pyrophosphohydrolase [Defluviitaleaceae bacterium]
MADLLYAELIKKIGKYHPATRLTLIEDAYNFALEAHGTQRRNSGEPYIVHPLSVATILAELELDLESIAAGILHDVVEDTSMTGADIERRFSHEIAMLVEGVTKLEKMKYTSKVEEQAENYRKMFLAMAKDIRVILIKIADRLHNMRTLSFMLPDKRREIAQETIDIYAPLAHRLGISKLRYELEDLSFKNLDPKAYFDLAGQISEKQTERKAYVDQIVGEINEKMASSNMAASVEGRPKHFFSIYKKMIAKNKTLDQIYDLFAVRVMVGEVRECYEVMGLLHETYLPIPGRVKDYIAMPKSNKYQSLHTTLISHGGEPFEVQIRTQEMHRVSEYGIAAHWKYKENEGSAGETDSEEEKLNWLRQMLDWQRELSDNGEFLDALRTDLSVFKNNVYCFTPKGDVINLTSGSTPIDFAYAIHSEVGNKMVGARVNGKIVTFDYALATGDRIEIITSQSSKGPGLDWLKLVKTNQARTKINQWFKNENRLENIQKGRELLEAEARKKNVSLQELLESGREASVLERFNFVDLDSLCAAVGYGGVRETQIVSRLYVEYEKTLPTATDAEILQELIDESDTAA